jgi:hypothetical protein
MNRQPLLLATVLLSTGCTRPASDTEAAPSEAAPSEAAPSEAAAPTEAAVPSEATPPTEAAPSVDRVSRFEVGLGMATMTERDVLDYRGSAKVEAWLAQQGAIEDIWLGSGVCVRTASGVSCKTWDGEVRIEPPTEAPVIDLEWTYKSICAATSDGALWCSFGNDPASKPLRRFPVSTVTDVEIEDQFGCARLQDGSAQCWSGDRLSLGEFCERTPDAPGCPPGDAKWPAPSDSFPNTRDIAVGWDYVCILDADGTPRCRDETRYQKVVIGKPGEFVAIEGTPPLVEIDGGFRHVCGRTEAGEVWCWGSNEYGQLGDGTTQSTEATTPVRAGSFAKLEALALGSHESCVLAEGQTQCWGWVGDAAVEPIPTVIPGVLASELDVGEMTACARVDAGWKCWGGPADTLGGVTAASQIVDVTRDGQFGDGCRLDDRRLRCDDGDEVWLDVSGVVDVVRTSDPLCVLRQQRVECHETFSEEPTVIRVPASVSIHGSIFHGCVLTKTGEVHCWADEGPAKQVELPGKQVALSYGFEDACALDEAGTVRCWGSEQPMVVVGVPDIVELHGGLLQGCGRNRAGALACWGKFLVADDQQTPEPTPERPLWLELPAPAVEFGIGDEYGCARLDDGRVACWGSEAYGSRARLSTEFVTRPKGDR